MLTQSGGDVVFLLDVDNTLLDNDRFGADLGARLEQVVSAELRRSILGHLSRPCARGLFYVDYLGSLLPKFRHHRARRRPAICC